MVDSVSTTVKNINNCGYYISKLRSCLDKKNKLEKYTINQILDELNLINWDSVPTEVSNEDCFLTISDASTLRVSNGK